MACIAGIYPVCDIASYPGIDTASTAYGMAPDELIHSFPKHNPIDRLGPLAMSDVPIMHIHRDADEVVPLGTNSGELANRYRSLGGEVRVLVVPGDAA